VLVGVDIHKLPQMADVVLVVLGMVQRRARALEVTEAMEAIRIFLPIVLVPVEVLEEMEGVLHQPRLEQVERLLTMLSLELKLECMAAAVVVVVAIAAAAAAAAELEEQL